ncbi:MAG: hypothetical protein AB7D57_12745 [Desulfovibrionaceae bacterium]
MRWFLWLFRRKGAAAGTEVRFSRRPGRSRGLSSHLSFNVDVDLDRTIRAAAGGDDAPLLRACIVLARGAFVGNPDLMQRVDQAQGALVVSRSLLVSQPMMDGLVADSGNHKARLVRACIRLALPYLSVHPEVVSTLDRG